MSEKNAYKSIKKAMCYLDRIDRVENRLLAGMPDINACLAGGVDVWIEMKSPKEPKRMSTPLFGSNHKISQDQKNWFKRHLDSGGKGFYLIYTDKRIIVLNAHFSDTINEMSLEQIIDNSSFSTLKPVRDKKQWNLLREALMT
jgi:hypothetical protein